MAVDETTLLSAFIFLHRPLMNDFSRLLTVAARI